ncbi:MAG: PIN domain-containing protein [Deltaproteobacteria bacterium]|nr:PIN domain-containing protein [Deltaproteobacteria bacterium]
MHVIDTNVLVYAANEDTPEHAACAQRLHALREGMAPSYVTWGILYEFVRVVTHPRVFRLPWSPSRAWSFTGRLLADGKVRPLLHGARHLEIAAQLAAEVPGLSGNLLFDAQTVALMREHGIRRIWTRDADFYRFSGIEVLDPLRAEG